MKRYYCLYLLLLLFIVSCQSHTKDKQEVEETISHLKDSQGDASIYLGDELFYPEGSIFAGTLQVAHNLLSLNIKSQLGGHIMLTISEPNGLNSKPYHLTIEKGVPTTNSVMIGRLADSPERVIEGYVMHEGKAIVTAISTEKFVMHINGIAGKYMETDQTKWKKVAGTIVIRKPQLRALGINEALFYY